MASHWDYYQFKAVEFGDKPDMVRTHLGTQALFVLFVAY